MGKKFFNRQEATLHLSALRAEGKSDQEIYNEMSQVYYDKKSLALFITGTPLDADKQRYKVAQNALLALLLISVVIKISLVVLLSHSIGSGWPLLLILVVPIINVVLFWEIRKYNAGVYRVCAGFAFASLSGTFNHRSASSLDTFVNVMFVLAIVVLAFYLDAKLFPKYKPMSMQKDPQGEYIL